jgi:DNA repair photolyase
MDLRPADTDLLERTLRNGLKNKNPKSSLASALSLKKTLRLGNRTDPYQDAEKELHVSRKIQQILIDLEWTYVIQTKFLSNMIDDEDIMEVAHTSDLVQIMPIITVGAEQDWELLERERTTPIPRRLRIMKHWIKRGYNVGVNGEPFIPGYHTPEQFRDILKRLKNVGVNSYNTYNLHFNDHVAKRLHEIGLDIEKIWWHNQDAQWRPILQQLLDISKEEEMVLGCPDFVNSGWDWKEQANTCCGINVPNPSWYNSHHWKRMSQKGILNEKIIDRTWEGIGDKETGEKIVYGEKCQFYTMKDAKK